MGKLIGGLVNFFSLKGGRIFLFAFPFAYNHVKQRGKCIKILTFANL